MKVVGLTGGIGSGKSTVARIFNKLGIPIYDSDQRAKDLYSESLELKSAMILQFGANIYVKNEIDRKKLAQIVFNDKLQLELLNNLVHPLLQQDFEHWKTEQNSTYVIREAAILIESGAYKNCDKVIVVTANEKIRIERVMERDSVMEVDVKHRISNQLNDGVRLEYADFEISNDGSSSLIEQVIVIDRLLS